MFRSILFLMILTGLVACDSSTPEFYYTKGNLKYKYHDIVEDGRVPKIGDYLTVYIDYKTNDGKLIYSSKDGTYDHKQTIHLGTPSVEGGIEEGFAQLMEGDSVTFYIEAQKFYSHYLFDDVPADISPEDEILITLRLLKIETTKEYESRLEKEEEACDIQEFMTIDSIVNAWKQQGELVQEINGIYMVVGSEESIDTLKYGMNVAVFYKGYYPNNKVFYSNLDKDQADEFKVGVEGQTLEGMKIALLQMTLGQSAKIVVPSYLGFSNHMIESGQVPACTPLIFELNVLPK